MIDNNAHCKTTNKAADRDGDCCSLVCLVRTVCTRSLRGRSGRRTDRAVSVDSRPPKHIPVLSGHFGSSSNQNPELVFSRPSLPKLLRKSGRKKGEHRQGKDREGRAGWTELARCQPPKPVLRRDAKPELCVVEVHVASATGKPSSDSFPPASRRGSR